MTKDYSPFTPGQPVPVDFFVGRAPEIEHLTAQAGAAARGRLQVTFLTGERGIGKSSLARYVRLVAEGKHRTLGLHAFLGGVSSLEEMARRVFDRLLKESIDRSWEDRIRDFFGNHIKQVGLFGVSVEFGAPDKDLRRMANDFAPALRNLMVQLKGEKDAILLVLDDINGLASSPDFANWIKSLVDEIATSQTELPLYLMLVGLEEKRQALISQQPSLARVFDIVEIKTWSDEETREFFLNAFRKVNVPVANKALSVLSEYAGGLPVLAHEIGDAAFKADQDNSIDEDDALQGVMAAADIVGRKHLEPQVYQAIRSMRYRTILRKASMEFPSIRFKRADLLPHLGAEERKVLGNFLTRMKRLNVLRPDPEGGPGVYMFSNHLHLLYFWLEAYRAKKTREQ